MPVVGTKQASVASVHYTGFAVYSVAELARVSDDNLPVRVDMLVREIVPAVGAACIYGRVGIDRAHAQITRRKGFNTVGDLWAFPER